MMSQKSIFSPDDPDGTDPFAKSIFTNTNLDLASAKDLYSSIVEMSRAAYVTRNRTYIVTSQSGNIRFITVMSCHLQEPREVVMESSVEVIWDQVL